MKQRDEWKQLVPFAPNVCLSVVMIRMKSQDEVVEFIQCWKGWGIEFKGHPIRARADKSPDQRKANSNIYTMTQHLKGVFVGKEVDADFKHSSVWIDDCEVAKWDTDAAKFKWMDEDIQKAGLVFNKEEAENALRQQ